MKRAAKEARRQQRESRLSNAGGGDEKSGMMMVPPAEEPAGPSQFEVSVTPDEEVDNPVEASANGDLKSRAPTQSTVPPSNDVLHKDPRTKDSSISHNRHLTQVSNARGNISPTPNPSAGSPSTRNPTPIKVSSSKRPRPSTGTENAEAGPSTSKVPKTPNRKTATTKRTPAKSTPAKVKEDDPWPFSRSSKGDEDLRARLTDQASKNEYLAEKFWAISHLNRLEEQGSESKNQKSPACVFVDVADQL